MIPPEQEQQNDENFDLFKDCLSSCVVAKLGGHDGSTTRKKKRGAIKGRKREIKPVRKVDEEACAANDAAELAEFVEYIAEEIFSALPAELRGLSYAAVQNDVELMRRYTVPLETATLNELVETLPLTVSDSLCSYGLIAEAADTERFLEPAITSYISSAVAAPAEYTPSVTASRPEGCEICQREHLPLTYHHLIPRQMHAKAVKRAWHSDWELNKVAWLCRACHSYVHKIASNEELARELYSVELLLEREEVQKWAAWVSKVRWKAR